MTATKKSRYIAAQCWCDPRVENRKMDVELAEVFAEVLDMYRCPLTIWSIIACISIATAIICWVLA